MLMRNFMTAEELGLREIERDALVQVLGLLERGEVEHARELRQYMFRDPANRSAPVGLSFNMAFFEHEHSCGTACCIGGLAKQFLPRGDEFRLYQNRVLDRESQDFRMGLLDLFMVAEHGRSVLPRGVYDMHVVTVEQGAQALANYLTTGAPRWREVF